MLDINLKNKYMFNIYYNDMLCKFIPIIQQDYKKLPNELEGYVIYIEKGAYNPYSWTREIKINKKSIIQ